MSATNLGAMFKARRSPIPGDQSPDRAPSGLEPTIPPAPAFQLAREQPIWHGMVAEFGWPAEGVPWTPALHQLVAAARVDPAVVVVLEESDTQPLTLRAVPAAQFPAVRPAVAS
jgi:hypothetical protein